MQESSRAHTDSSLLDHAHLTTAEQRQAFARVTPGKKDINGPRYLARSVEEYRYLGGDTDPQYPEARSIVCVVDKIDVETGVATLTVMLDWTGRLGLTVRDVPFANPKGNWPGFKGDPGGTWHFIVEV